MNETLKSNYYALLIAITKGKTAKESLLAIGMSYYHDFEEDIPDSFKILKMLEDMDSNISEEKEKPLQPISEKILSYYNASQYYIY